MGAREGGEGAVLKASGRWFVRSAGKTPALSCTLQVSRQSTADPNRGGLLVHTFHVHLWGSEPPQDTQEKQFDIEMSEREMRSLYEKIGNALDGIKPHSAPSRKDQDPTP